MHKFRPLYIAAGALIALLLLVLVLAFTFPRDTLSIGLFVLSLALCAAALGLVLYAIKKLIAAEQPQIERFENLVSTLGHDLRGPLQSMHSAASLLAGDLTVQDKAMFSDSAKAAIAEMSRHIEDLVRVTRGQPLSWQSASVDMDKWFLKLAADYQPKAKAKNLNWKAICQTEVPELQIDADRLTQAIGHLVDNAIRYSKAGEITVELSYQAGPQQAVLTVMDTGPGIPEQEKARIFKPFERAASGASKRLGIGLTVAAKIAQAAGGTLSVDSQVGKGSTFTIVVPAKVGMLAPTPIVDDAPAAAVARESAAGAEVLLVDTHRRLLEPFSNLLVDAGFAVEYVVGEAEGLARLASAPFGVVVSYIETQIVNGFTFAQKSKKAKDKPYFIAWDTQTNAFPGAAQHSLFDAVLESSISHEGFLDAVEKGLKRA
ncbi:MAG: hypothetical protein CFE43_21055 [Burkholderiales bacterium PBB3]|nr:MAG: hypothetical protein CFE43_21055 [Burkholderiales bacterium PBB3]